MAGNLTRNVAANGDEGILNHRLKSGPLGLAIQVPSQEGCSVEQKLGLVLLNEQ